MAANREEISRYFDEGVAAGATHMLMICDPWDYEDFPFYVGRGASAHAAYVQYQQREGCRVMEVYDLRLPKEPQLAEERAFHLGQEEPR